MISFDVNVAFVARCVKWIAQARPDKELMTL